MPRSRLAALVLLLASSQLPLALGQMPSSQQGAGGAYNAIPPSIFVQPMYACRMEVRDLPEYSGFPSPEMQAGNVGKSESTFGMLDQWNIPNNGEVEDTRSFSTVASGPLGPLGPVGRQAVSPASTGGPVGLQSPITGNQQQQQQQQLSAAPAAAPNAGEASSLITSRPEAGSRALPTASAAAATPATEAAVAPDGASSAMPAAAGSELDPFSPGKGWQGVDLGGGRVSVASLSGAAVQAGLPNARLAAPAGSAEAHLVAAATAASSGPRSSKDRARWQAQLQERAEAGQGSAAPAAAAAAAAVAPSRRVDNATVGAAAAGSTATLAAALAVDTEAHTSPARRLFQAPVKSVCNKGTPTDSEAMGPPGSPTFKAPAGQLGLTMAASGVIPADAAVAVGPAHVVHVVNSLVKILPIGRDGSMQKTQRPGQARTIPLPDWFATVASPCDGGYITPAATYDKLVGRFLVTAICGGDANQVLLAVSSNQSATGSWVLYSFPGEATQSTLMRCTNDSYPTSFHSQVSYNQDGVFLSFVQNCPLYQESATGAIIYALPKWAVYKGATYFWAPGWTAYDIYDAVGIKNNDEFYPGAFLQMQPVIPQRASDVQAEVTYFVSDNLNYVNPLQRTQITVAALINTGSLWLYEGPSSNAPSPLLVARVVARGMLCVAVPDTKLIQPRADPEAGIPECQRLDGGAMRPPGIWDGGAALYANKIYLADRGPDFFSEPTQAYMPTIYWAQLTPSFCVSGPCAPWFGTDWGWSEGWDWDEGTWDENSDRGRAKFRDPAYYNQVFLFPSAAEGRTYQQASLVHLRRRSLLAAHELAELLPANRTRWGPSGPMEAAPGTGVAAEGGAAEAQLHALARASGSLTLSALMADRKVSSRAQMLASVKAALDRMEALKPSASPGPVDMSAADWAAVMRLRFPQAAAAAGLGEDAGSSSSSNRSREAGGSSSRSVGVASVSDLGLSLASPVHWADGAAAAAPFAAGPAPSSGSSLQAGAPGDAAAAASSAGGRNVSAAFFFGGPTAGAGAFSWRGWAGYGDNLYYYDYYQFWREHYFLRNLYMNIRVPPKTNPCKYYKDWPLDNTITFGAAVSRKGVIEFVSQGDNPVGLAAPAVAVRGGSMLIVYSFSGPHGLPQSSGGVRAFPGVGYTVIDGSARDTGGAFNLAQAGVGCVEQAGSTRWGSYSGADVHFPSYRVWTAVEYAWQKADFSGVISNAGTWLSVFS